MSRAIRIIIADDHPLFCSALRTLLEERAGFEVVAQASDGQEALELARRFRPELVLMDVSMPMMDGVEATRALKRELPRTVVLMMTASEEPEHLAQALKVGAAGYVLKSAPPQQIINASRRALEGESPLNQEVAKELLIRLMGQKQEKERRSSELVGTLPVEDERSGEAVPSSLLTEREVEVLRLLAQGQTNHQIARHLLVSVSTVKKHVGHVISKLGVSDRTQAAIKAIELELFREHSQ